jgi:type I restriction enzyme S subunit
MSESLEKLANIYYGKSPNEVVSIDGHIPIVGTGGIYGWADKAMFERGIVVARKGSLGTPHLFKTPFWPVDTTYAVVPNTDVDIDWLYYCLLNFDLTKLNEATGVPSINRNWLGKTSFKNPGAARQTKIAAILSSIDETIEKTEALIEKYQQIKAGLMHDLFTRGIGADGKLRPPREQAPDLYQQTSIGWIPKEWIILPAEKTQTRIIDYRGKTPDKTVAGIPLITAKNVRMGYIDPDPMEFIAEDDYEKWMTRGIPNKGDVLFTTEAPLGNIAQINTDDRVAFAQRVIILQSTDQFEPSIIAYRLMTNSTQNAISRLASGSTALGIKQSEFRKVLLSLPNSKLEQKQIIKKLVAIDMKLSSELDNMSKLQNQKSGLMHDLLTGKVQVRTEAVEADHARRTKP